MNISSAPVTRPSARVPEDRLRSATERPNRANSDRTDSERVALLAQEIRRQSGAPQRPSEAVSATLSTPTTFQPRPAGEELLPPLPSRQNLPTTTASASPQPQRGASPGTTNLTPQYRASHAQQQSLLERLLRQEGGLSAADTAALSRHKPLSSDVFHESVLAYLESTGRHDVVMAMLQDERNAQNAAHSALGMVSSSAVGSGDRLFTDLANSAQSQPSSSTPRSFQGSPMSAPNVPLRGSTVPARDETAPPDTASAAKAKLHMPNQRRSHDLLKKGLLETYAQWAREPRVHHSSPIQSSPPRSPPGAGGATSSPAPAGLPARGLPTTLAFAPPVTPSLSQVLATLYGMPEGLRGDITLLYCDIEDKLRLQYEAYALVPPAPRVLAQIGAQLRQPMWSAMDTAESIHLPPVRNRVTGNVVMGTVNQLVEELTHVYVKTGGSGGAHNGNIPSPSEAQAQVDAAFAECFFRQHRLFTPSSVLLAKLFERFAVPISVPLDFNHFEGHGITIHIEKGGLALMRERSQSETVVRLRGQADAATWEEDAHSSSWHQANDGFGHRADDAWRSSQSNVFPFPSSASVGPSSGVSKRSSAPDRFGFPSELSPGGSQMRLVTHYSRSATLWLLICEKIRTKVLSVLLMWMQHHPNHFDVSMIHCVLHFVEECCYEPTQWSDCASTFPQIAELLRDEAYNILKIIQREHQDPVTGYPSNAPGKRFTSESVEVLEALRGGRPGGALAKVFPYVLSAFATDDRLKYLRAAVPPSMRDSQPMMPTWLSAAVTLPNRLLPAFANRSDDILGLDAAFRTQSTASDRQLSPSAFGASTFDISPATQARLRGAAQRAIDRFQRYSMEEYVGGLTAAHQLLFGLFPAQDLATLAEHTTAEYLSSRAVRQSHLVVFLRSASDLTAWASSLLLHAAFLDGEHVASSMANASIVSSLLNTGCDLDMPLPSALGSHASPGMAATSASGMEASSTSGDGFAPSSQSHGLGETTRISPRSATSVRVHSVTKLDAATMTFVSVAETLLDLVVAFLRVNNVHASYAVFRGFCHPFVQRILRHPALQVTLNAHTLRRVAKLELFYGLSSHGDDAGTSGNAASSKYDDPSASFIPQHFTQSMQASITSDVGIGGAHVLPDFLKAVSDSAEFPTVPAIPFQLRELRYAMTHEPTFLTTTCGDFPVSKMTAKGERCEPLVCVVNWRKLRIVDDIIERVSNMQSEALFYVSSKSTVVRTLTEDVELERNFKEQLDEVIVTDVNTLQAMANCLLSALH